MRPYYVLRRSARARLANTSDVWAPIAEMFRMGCHPIGYVRGEFVIYAPQLGEPHVPGR